MNSRFGTSELRLNLLDASLPFEWVHLQISLPLIAHPRYPVNVYSDVFDPRTAQSYEDLARSVHQHVAHGWLPTDGGYRSDYCVLKVQNNMELAQWK